MESSGQALSNIRICDFSGQLAGAGATKILAAFGAQIIRIEDRVTQGHWDIFRGSPPFIDERRGNELGGTFNNHNVEKLGVTLNMRVPKAKELLSDLIAISDVVTENFSAGVLKRWGFSYEDMAAIKPDIIYVSNCGFGHVGPYSHFKTWGPIVQAVSGLTFQSGLSDMEPAGWGYSYMNHTGGYFMAVAILMALYHRNKTGEGQWVDMSCTDAAATLNGPKILDYTVNGRAMHSLPRPNSNRNDSPKMAPHGIYRCDGHDNWVAIAVRNEGDWRAMCGVLGRADLIDDERFSTVEGRFECHDELDALIESWTSKRNPFDVMEAFQKKGVPAAAVQRPEERIDKDPNTQAWGLFPEVKHPEMGKVRVDGLPFKLSKAHWNIRRGAPLLGEHNDIVYGDVLGLGKKAVLSLLEEEVI